MSEPHSAQVQQTLWDAEQIVVSLLVGLELTTALTQRAYRDHAARLSGRQFTLLLKSFRTDWETFNMVPLDETLLLSASELVIRHRALGLRSMDAIYVASAQLAANAFDDLAFLTFDERQRRAAEAEELVLLT